MKKLNSTVALLAGLVCMMLPALAAAQNYDPPGRVARIRYIKGSVSFAPAGESEWVAAVTNRPVTIGDQLWVDADSRAELDAGSAVIRMNANTGISFLNLDDRTLQVQLTQGAINLRVRRLHPGDIVEVDTPNQAFSVVEPGLYRVAAGADGNSSMVVVRQGHGQVTGGGQSYDLYSGQSGRFDGTGTESLSGQLASVSSPDDFDRWGESRDSQYERSQSARYVSPDVVGYEDLDGNGTWRSNPTYGNVWIPTGVQQGWAPYRNGHWVWISPWGWTWVDDEPWGYAPFHYGRWVSVGNQWGWVPGPQNVQPVYAPALVAFIGGSSFGASASVGGAGGYPGNVGWFPLAPQDPYVPGYYASPGYVQRVNTSNTVARTTKITNVYNNQVTNNITYVNRTVPGAVTVVPQNVVQSSAPVARSVVPVDVKRIVVAPVETKPSVAPTQASVLGATNATANRMAHPPEAVATRPVIAKTTPPPPPVPFAKQEQELAKQPGQPLPPQKVQTLRAARAAEVHPAVKLAPPSKPATLVASQPTAGSAKPGNVPGQQQVVQKQGEKARQQQAQQQAAQQQAEKAREQQAQQQAAQQQAEKAREQQAQQQAAQQQAEKARQQQVQQQAAQQQAEKARQQQAQQQAAQQQAEKARQQQAQQQVGQQQAEKAREQQAQQQAAQQQAEKARQQQAQQQARQQAPPQQAQPPASARPAQPPQKQPNSPQAQPTRPLTPEEKAREEKKKREEQTPRSPQ